MAKTKKNPKQEKKAGAKKTGKKNEKKNENKDNRSKPKRAPKKQTVDSLATGYKRLTKNSLHLGTISVEESRAVKVDYTHPIQTEKKWLPTIYELKQSVFERIATELGVLEKIRANEPFDAVKYDRPVHLTILETADPEKIDHIELRPMLGVNQVEIHWPITSMKVSEHNAHLMKIMEKKDRQIEALVKQQTTTGEQKPATVEEHQDQQHEPYPEDEPEQQPERQNEQNLEQPPTIYTNE